MFEVVKATGFDNSTQETSYELISVHVTRAEAEGAIEERVASYCSTRWPHRPEMKDVERDYYEVRDTGQ
jgi:hypothetical protein